MSIAIITGASSGIGREYVYALDSRSDVSQLWIAARSKSALEDVQARCSTSVRIFAGDLCDPALAHIIYSALEKSSISLRYLVNSAGRGKNGPFSQSPLSDQLSHIRLNCQALVRLTHTVLPFCIPGSVIYNISSCAGFAPLGNYAVYAASKAFVNSFSLSLRAEVRDQDIQVITVTPASVDTHFHIISRGESGRQKRYFNSRISPRTVVEKSIQSAERNRVFSCPDRVSRAACFWRKLVPHPLIARLAFIKLYQ